MAPWFESARFYHIYPLGLCACPRENDFQSAQSQLARGAREHGVPLPPMPFTRLAEWADHAASLGFTALYVGPLFQSSTHGYDTVDYRMVDSRLGTNEDFRAWVAHCHRMGVKVVVDGVFNHTGRDFFAFRDLREKRWDSWARDWYRGVNFDWQGPFGDGFGYEGWRGVDILPALNLQNQQVRDYLLDVAQFWLEEFDIDGIRLDSADVMDFEFLRQLVGRMKGLRGDFWLMGEVINGNYERWLNEAHLDSVTNYELSKAIWSGHNSHNYFEMGHNVLRLFGPYGLCQGAYLYTFCDNQDVERIASKLNDERDLVPVTIFLFTILGIPSVYYGSEFGIQGRKGQGALADEPLRPALDLATLEVPHPEIAPLIRALCDARDEHPELSFGRYQEVSLQTETYAFARVLDAGHPENHFGRDIACLTALSNADDERELWLDLPVGASEARVIAGSGEAALRDGKLWVRLAPHGGCVFELI